MEKETVLQKRIDRIQSLTLDYGINGMDVYLDAYNEYKRMLREYYVKHGTLMKIDDMDMTYTFLSIFYKGKLQTEPFYENYWAGECMLYSFYVELIKIGEHLALKPMILNILAANGSKESEVYRLIVNDKTARNQQEKLEKNTKRVRRQQVSVAV